MTRYTYGDSIRAAERPRLVASMFEASSSAFLRSAAPARPSLAIDLGCGPGFTTALVHSIAGAARTVGIDASSAFVEAATADAPAGVTFLEHDATDTPFPTDQPDLVYARLLLAHLSDATAVVKSWCTSLRPGGRLLIDDLESIVSDDPVFRAYLDEVAVPVVRRQGGAMFVGPILHGMDDPEGCRRVVDRVSTIRPSVAVTARVFGMNLDVLVGRGETPPRADLAEGLRARAEAADAESVVWRMRQIAFERS